jgi:hypothetical protein
VQSPLWHIYYKTWTSFGLATKPGADLRIEKVFATLFIKYFEGYLTHLPLHACINILQGSRKNTRGVTNEFQVNPENHMLRNACKMHMQIFHYFITAATVDLLTNNLKSCEFFVVSIEKCLIGIQQEFI